MYRKNPLKSLVLYHLMMLKIYCQFVFQYQGIEFQSISLIKIQKYFSCTDNLSSKQILNPLMKESQDLSMYFLINTGIILLLPTMHSQFFKFSIDNSIFKAHWFDLISFDQIDDCFYDSASENNYLIARKLDYNMTY